MGTAVAPIGYQDGGYTGPTWGGAGFELSGTPSPEDIFKTQQYGIPRALGAGSFDFTQSSQPGFYGSSSAPGISPLQAPEVAAEDVSGGIKKAAGIVGTASGFAAFVPFIGPILSGVGAVGSVIMNWWTADKQMEENRRAQKRAQEMYQQQMAESRRRYDVETEFRQAEAQKQQQQFVIQANLAAERQAHDIAMDEEKIKVAKEQQQWDRWLMLMNNMVSMMSTPQSRAQTAQLYRR